MGAIGERPGQSPRSISFRSPTQPVLVQPGEQARFPHGAVQTQPEYSRWGHSHPSGSREISPHGSSSRLRFSGNPRCREKGCVFPAVSSAGGFCHYHALEQSEPACFRSYQPSGLLLEKAKFGLSRAGYEDGRARDRRLLASLRENVEEIN